jgi:FMN phosphatase YigB (HAD superfamily)
MEIAAITLDAITLGTCDSGLVACGGLFVRAISHDSICTMMFTLAAFLARLLLFNNVFASPTHDTFDPSAGNSREILSRALIIDVDNTLYSERALRVRGRGIEEQIVSNTHHFCASRLNMTKEEADDLFRKYGSTVEGLRQTLPREDVEQILIDYYHQVWSDNIDYSSLLPFQKLDGKHGTGYSHESATRSLQELLERIGLPITFASNSPSWHVHKVLKSLGLCKVQNHGILAPDTTSCVELMYPTKARPDIFYRSILPQLEEKNFVLLDDSAYNVKEATKHGIEGIKVDESGLERSLGEALGHVDRGFVFSESEYLKAKNQVDAKSINTNVWSELARNVKLQKDSILRIADLGAGRLFMLEMLLQDSGHTPPLVDLIPGKVRGIEYHAYESNRRLYRVCHETLSQLGFREEPQSDEPKEGDVNVFLNAAKNVMVHLHWYEYETEVMDLNRGFTPDVIVGCCFADLVSPSELVTGVKRFVQKMKASHEVLVYFPITFSGTTQLLPPQPYQKSHGQKWIPSDTEAFRVYSKALAEEHGHNVEPERLIDEFERHGGELLCQGKSNWVIDKKENNALWETMLYFFGMVAAPRLLKNGFDSLGWVQRSRNCPVTIEVSNIDLLFRLEAPLRQSELNVEPTNKDLMELEEIQFTAPYEVGTVKRSIRRDLAPNQVLIRTDYSLVSSGTELKIFRGMFDDAALDVNIKGMAEKRLSYPLSYGYSLVGHVSSRFES